jgi:transcription elongation GreA/GreB family factor
MVAKIAKIEPTELLLDLREALQNIYTFESPESQSDHLHGLEKSHRQLIESRRTSERKRSKFIQNSIGPLSQNNEYLNLRELRDLAQEQLVAFEKQNMKSLQNFKKRCREYEEAKRFIYSFISSVSEFAYFELKEVNETKIYFIYPDEIGRLSLPLENGQASQISNESSIGKSSLGKKSEETIKIVLPGGELKESVIGKIWMPKENEISGILEEIRNKPAPVQITSELDKRENRNHRDRHRTPS